MQEVGVFILFLGALFSLGWEFYKIFRPSKTTCGNCSSCGGVNFDEIEKKIKKEIN
jgi:hypothetical protein